jgi:hypothetical protein
MNVNVVVGLGLANPTSWLVVVSVKVADDNALSPVPAGKVTVTLLPTAPDIAPVLEALNPTVYPTPVALGVWLVSVTPGVDTG